MVFGQGWNDIGYVGNEECYTVWHSMLRRCYSTVYHKSKPAYIGTMVSKDWKTLSKFKEWYDNNYVEGWHLDKDILVKGSKLYSPETCCFVPEEINSALIAKSSKTGLPIGVYFKKRNGKFCAQMSVCNNGVRESGYIGLYATVEAAFSAYKAEKEKYIQSLAEKHKTALAANAYEALVNWNVEITD